MGAGAAVNGAHLVHRSEGNGSEWCSECGANAPRVYVYVAAMLICPRCAIRIGELGRHAQRLPVRVERTVDERMPEDEPITAGD